MAKFDFRNLKSYPASAGISAYKTVTPEGWVFPAATMKDSELYIMSHPQVDGHKIGLAVNAKTRARGIGKNMNICMVTKRVHRDTMEAIEHLAQAYALVKYGQQSKLPKEIVSGRSEFFKCSEKQAKAFIACAFRQAKKLGMNALEIATYALDYILKHLGKVPRNMARWVKHVRDAQEKKS